MHRRRIAALGIVALLALGSASAGPLSAGRASQAPSSLGEWQCWHDGSPDPCHRDLNALTMVSADVGGAGGDGGSHRQ